MSDGTTTSGAPTAPENGPDSRAHITYRDAGVDVDEGARAVGLIKEAVAATARPEVIGGLGGFTGLFSAENIKRMEDPILVSGADGVGTKLKVAQMFDRHETVGIDLVAMCVNDLIASGAEPLFFLDYIAIGHIDAEHVAQIVAGIAEGCRQAGCALVGGEMAEHPGVMAAEDYDLAGFCVGVVDRPKMILPELVQEGDVILGLASSGLHSNGYSLVRRVLLDGRPAEDYLVPSADLDGKSMAEALLEPTRIYVKPIRALLEQGLPVHGIAHITGGGITENLNRALPPTLDALIDAGSWDIPPIISRAADAAGLSVDEAYETFNMGVGMAVICPPDAADAAAQVLTDAGEKVFPIGVTVPGSGRVILD